MFASVNCNDNKFNVFYLSLQPYNEEYLKSLKPPAKHLAFHSYLKKLKAGVAR